MHILTGQTLSFDHAESDGRSDYAHHLRGAVVLSDDGRIAWSGDASSIPEAFRALPYTDHGSKLIMAGFVDPHLHFPQYRMLAAHGKDLLDWLNRYTFIEEQRYADEKIAAHAAAFFLDELIANGTTACLAFSTIHATALNALFEVATTRNMAVMSGLTLMDRNAPEALRNDIDSVYDENLDSIAKWNGRGRLGYVISPRFAITASEALLELCGDLCRRYPDIPIQTHLSENREEIELTAKLFPWAKHYTDVYDRYGLVRNNSLFAHGIHLSDNERRILSEAGASIIHCPTSNNFLGSGLFQWQLTEIPPYPVKVGIGSDIGGGTSYSMLATMRDAYIVSQLAGARIDPLRLFRTASIGNAGLIGRSHEFGNLEAGKVADLIVLDPKATPLMAERDRLSETLNDRLFALLMLGDDRAVSETYIAGQPVKRARR